MWLCRGVQSAIFYYVTCTPCATGIDRRKRRKEAARCQREKARCTAIITDQPRVFPQPTPFSTNEGWRDEIELGPGPPARKGGHRPPTHRVGSQQSGPILSSSSVTSTSTLGDESAQRKEKGKIMSPLGERWNWMRYQREDEPLWGDELKGSSVGISGRPRTNTVNSGKYCTIRVPPVNDLHPPIVSGPTSRAETRWMLQPPPPAKVMAGKERYSSARISRDDSFRRSVKRRTPYGQQGDQKMDELRIGDRWVPNEPKVVSRSTSPEKGHHRPITITNDSCITRPTNFASENQKLSTYSPLATIASRSEYIPNVHKAHSYSNTLFYTNSHSNSPAPSPPADPITRPGTPHSRSVSKDTDDSGKAFRPPLSNAMATLHHKQHGVQTVHLAINESKRSREQLQQARPWRWSFDI